MRSLEIRKQLAGGGLAAVAIACVLAGCGVTRTKTVTEHLTGSPTSTTTSSSTSTAAISTVKPAGPSTLSQSQLKSPAAIVDAATKAGEQASSVRMTGSVVEKGRQVALNVVFERGVGFSGTMALGAIKFDIVSVGGQVYFKYGRAAWIMLLMKRGLSKAQAEMVASSVAGRWLRAPAAQGKWMTRYFTLDALLRDLDRGNGVLKREPDATVGGRRAIVVKNTTKGGSLYIAADGAPYPLMVTGTKRSSAGRVVFSDYGAPIHIKTPANVLSLGTSAGVQIGFQPHPGRRSGMEA